MTEKLFPGPMSMIKIDGQKIKLLREQQGLTQLYLATAVDVTTDTISRWENKRYPSIKKENGIRLAEALEVDLEVILDQQEDVTELETKAEVLSSPPLGDQTSSMKRSINKSWPILLLAGTLLGVILAFMYSYFQLGKDLTITAIRISSDHFIAGQPFPVIIELSADSDKEMAFILKESIPSQATVIQTQPQHSGKTSETPLLKWITKAKVPTTFSYLIKFADQKDNSISFDGTIATAGGDPLPISGNNTITSGNHHWADSDRNNVISDKEILTVYDKFAEISGLEDEIDLIEEIWLGMDSFKINAISLSESADNSIMTGNG